MRVDNKKIKLFVVGPSVSYASWLNHEKVSTMEEADLVLFTGGEDINPKLYEQPCGQFTHYNVHRDLMEVESARKAIKLGKNIWGTCRGIQLGCAMSGGLLVQHMNHPWQHNLTLYDGTVIQVNSLHHQMQHPYNLHPSEYVVVGYAKGLSNVYLNGHNNEMLLPTINKGSDLTTKEAEIVYYRKTKWFGAQSHPEMLSYYHQSNNILRAMIDLMMEDTLDIVLTLSIPTSRFVGVDLVLTDDEAQEYEEILIKRKQVEQRTSLVN